MQELRASGTEQRLRSRRIGKDCSRDQVASEPDSVPIVCLPRGRSSGSAASRQAHCHAAKRNECCRQPLQVHGRGGEEGLNAHILEPAPHRTDEAMPCLGLAMEALRVPAVAPIVAPPLSAVVERPGRAIFLRRVAPPQAVAIDEDYAAQHPPVIDARLAVALGKEGLKPRYLRVDFNPDDKGLFKGIYLPLDLWRQADAAGNFAGKRGGKVLSYDNVGRRISNSEFVTLVSGAWVGTSTEQSAELSKVSPKGSGKWKNRHRRDPPF